MDDQKEKPQKPSSENDKGACRDLICPEEWQDPEGRKVLTEHHKEGLAIQQAEVDADLENFERYWKDKGTSIKVKGEYHKDGAPFLEQDTSSEAAERPKEPAELTIEVNTQAEPTIDQLVNAEMPQGPAAEKTAAASPPPKAQAPGDASAQGKAPGQIDLGLIELISYVLFKLAFKNGLSVPIKREGVADMDITVKGREITINTNQLYFSFPDLTVWHIVYTHKGKPIVEMGRGIKNGMKIHRWNAIRLGLEVWNGSRKMNKQKRAQAKEMERKAHSRPADE